MPANGQRHALHLSLRVAHGVLRPRRAVVCRLHRLYPPMPDSDKHRQSALLQGQKISVRGARTHNLKNIDLDIPRNQLVEIGRASCRERV